MFFEPNRDPLQKLTPAYFNRMTAVVKSHAIRAGEVKASRRELEDRATILRGPKKPGHGTRRIRCGILQHNPRRRLHHGYKRRGMIHAPLNQELPKGAL